MTNGHIKKKSTMKKSDKYDLKHFHKVYKEDSEINFSMSNIIHNKLIRKPSEWIPKPENHNSDYNSRHNKKWRKLKSMKVDHYKDLLLTEPWLYTKVAAGDDRNENTHNTISALCNTAYYHCPSPNDANNNQTPHDYWDMSIIPLKLKLQGNKFKYEISFDYNLKKDTEKEVAEELIKALDLPQIYDKKITKAIKSLLQDKILMIEMLMLMNDQKRRNKNKENKKQLDNQKNEPEQDEIEEAISLQVSLDDKIQFIKSKKHNYSFKHKLCKLFSSSASKLKNLNEEHINSRLLSHLNGTVNEKYKACDINWNMFNIHDFHNSFTASSNLKHSFHSTFDRMTHEYYRKHFEFPSFLIERALSEYDIKYYSHYEDIVEPNITDYSFENLESTQDPNFQQNSPPFVDDNLSAIEHHPHHAHHEVFSKPLISELMFY